MKILKIVFLIYILLSTIFMLITGISGCMMNTVKAIGHRRIDFDKYQSFVIIGDKLIVQYTTDIRATDPTPCNSSFYIERDVSKDVENWGIVDLDSGWVTPEINKEEKDLHWWGRSTNWWNRNTIFLSPSEGQPSLKNENYIDLKPHEESWYHSMEKTKPNYKNAEQTMSQQIQECLGDSTFCINFPYGHAFDEFVILKRVDQSGTVQCKRVTVRENRYYENWSKKVHYVLIPFAFIFDAIALPLTLASNLCM